MSKEYIFSEERGLKFRVYPAENVKQARGTIVFFYASGYWKGNFEQFDRHAEFFAANGFHAILGDYRVSFRYPGTTALDCVSDCFDLLQYLLMHANELDIDPDKIILSGGSAGGEIALTACLRGAEFGLKVAALILFYPGVGLPYEGDCVPRYQGEGESICPYKLMHGALPPCVIFHGDIDDKINMVDMRRFVEKAKQYHSDITLFEYPGRGHNFCNKNFEEDYQDTMAKTMAFVDKYFPHND